MLDHNINKIQGANSLHSAIQNRASQKGKQNKVEKGKGKGKEEMESRHFGKDTHLRRRKKKDNYLTQTSIQSQSSTFINIKQQT